MASIACIKRPSRSFKPHQELSKVFAIVKKSRFLDNSWCNLRDWLLIRWFLICWLLLLLSIIHWLFCILGVVKSISRQRR
ncbi:hypothetical protein PGT21_050263 [Puccinia graminis f. sp. tritici]|uniref:Uncharacterized protein n=1 Tax=Puccinia graminis f. sp. tritici TaxID=56615 RepID=A0A5B0N533_PUCGR|nr:hypothetical protein PGT21_050263 [Puccinia graminis f. sp. tritici]